MTLNLTKTFLDLKYESLLNHYPFLFIFQHNNLNAFAWKEIKKNLIKKAEKNKSQKTHFSVLKNQQTAKETTNFSKKKGPEQSIKPFGLYVIPKKNSRNIFSFSLEHDFNPINGPCCFFGCFNLEDLNIFRDILKTGKISPYSFFEIGLYVNDSCIYPISRDILQRKKLENNDANLESSNSITYLFFNFLEVEKMHFLIKKALKTESNAELMQRFLKDQNSYKFTSDLNFLQLFTIQNSSGIRFLQMSTTHLNKLSFLFIQSQWILLTMLHLNIFTKKEIPPLALNI
jgi:hypothetical protein